MQLPRIVGSIVLIFSFACYAQSYLPEVDVRAGDFDGRIIDGTTGQPIGGAIVVADWLMYSTPSLAKNKISLLHVTETASDAEGKFVIPNLGRDGPPIGWKKYPSDYPRFMVFKSGYATGFGNQGMWQAALDGQGNPLLSLDIAARYRNERGLVFPLYEYSKDPRRGPNSPELTPFSSAKLAAEYLTSNIDIDDLTHTGTKAQDIIQSQIRAFVVVNQEIEQTSGKKYSWDSRGQIAKAIDQAMRKGVKQ